MSLLGSLRDTAAPAVAVEVASRRVSAATVEFRGGQPVVGGKPDLGHTVTESAKCQDAASIFQLPNVNSPRSAVRVT